MNGLAYIMFVSDVSHKEVASKLDVSVQMVTNWLRGVKPIADKHVPTFHKMFGVSAEYFQKELTLQDKIEIELQLASKTKGFVDIDHQAATLHRQNEAMKEKYMKLLEAVNGYSATIKGVKEEVDEFHVKLLGLTEIGSLMNDPDGCELVFDLMKSFQGIRKELKN